ncbi:MAG: acyltransferase [Defluviitaleaceae bacterium]|nr:acyltransferase [Defluviitaleaceae bacterium]
MSKIKWFDAVRAYGLFLVLGYHLFYDTFPGGFLGVDIFFTFSGFLITALIVEEFRKHGTFSLIGFYKRRVKRIMIPLFFSVVFTLPFMLLISPDLSVGIAKQAAAALGSVTNWVEILSGGSYEARLLPSVYIHTWSLAIEMQFYLSWGLLCALVAAVSGFIFDADEKKRFACFKVCMLVLSGVFAVCSYLYMQRLHNAQESLDLIYFNTFTRFMPFFIGSFAAVIWGVRDKQHKTRELHPTRVKWITAGLIVLLLTAAGVILYDASQHKFADEFIFHYGFLFTSLLTVALIYGTHGLHCMTPPEKDEPKLLKAVADMSYNAYLYHWPFYVVFTAIIFNNTTASAVTLVFTFIFSGMMFYGAERVFIPEGQSGALKNRRAATTAVVAAVAAAAVLGGAVIYNSPEITSIENDFAVNYILRDAEGVFTLERRVSAIKTLPVAYAAEDEPLQKNLLPKDVPAAAATPTPVPFPTPAPETQVTPTQAPTQSTQAPTQPTQAPTQPTPTRAPAVTVDISGGVTVIGDSVPLGAQSTMQKNIPDCYVDALVSRPVSAGKGIMTDLQNRGELREYVVIALGTNGTNNYAKLFTEIIDALNPGHKLIFVTPFDGRANDNAKIINNTAAWMRDLPDQYDFVTIADWNALISTQADILAKDKVHMGGQTSMTLYSNCVAEAIERASGGPLK